MIAGRALRIVSGEQKRVYKLAYRDLCVLFAEPAGVILTCYDNPLWRGGERAAFVFKVSEWEYGITKAGRADRDKLYTGCSPVHLDGDVLYLSVDDRNRRVALVDLRTRTVKVLSAGDMGIG